MTCFGCGETRHRLAECKKALFVEADDCDDTKPDIKGKLVYDEEAVDEVLFEGDMGTALVVRHSCFTPKATEEDDWLRKYIF